MGQLLIGQADTFRFDQSHHENALKITSNALELAKICNFIFANCKGTDAGENRLDQECVNLLQSALNAMSSKRIELARQLAHKESAKLLAFLWYPDGATWSIYKALSYAEIIAQTVDAIHSEVCWRIAGEPLYLQLPPLRKTFDPSEIAVHLNEIVLCLEDMANAADINLLIIRLQYERHRLENILANADRPTSTQDPLIQINPARAEPPETPFPTLLDEALKQISRPLHKHITKYLWKSHRDVTVAELQQIWTSWTQKQHAPPTEDSVISELKRWRTRFGEAVDASICDAEISVKRKTVRIIWHDENQRSIGEQI